MSFVINAKYCHLYTLLYVKIIMRTLKWTRLYNEWYLVLSLTITPKNNCVQVYWVPTGNEDVECFSVSDSPSGNFFSVYIPWVKEVLYPLMKEYPAGNQWSSPIVISTLDGFVCAWPPGSLFAQINVIKERWGVNGSVVGRQREKGVTPSFVRWRCVSTRDNR
jgi:hypothetical protein